MKCSGLYSSAISASPHGGPFYISSVEMTICGNDTGVHGRWNQQTGQVISSVFASQRMPNDGADTLPPLSNKEQLALLQFHGREIDISFAGDANSEATQPNTVQQTMLAIATENSAGTEESGDDPELRGGESPNC
jgi:hypothetical protein